MVASEKPQMKLYAVVTDVSPSEQLGDDDDAIFCLGALFGLKSPKSFDLVGENFPNQDKRLRLRKYAGATSNYKKQAIEHIKAIGKSGHVLAGISAVNQRFIKEVGLEVWVKAHGPIQPPSSFNKKQKPRVMLGGYTVNGRVTAPYEVLVDDLIILGWLTLEFGLIHKALCEANNELVKLHILIDRLPHEKGAAGTNKAELLKWTLEKFSKGTISVVGIPDHPDHNQRDLLVDNIAGLGRDIFASNTPTQAAQELKGIVGITAFNIR